MAHYTDLPEEINREVLLRQSPNNIIHHCNVDTHTRKICDKVSFWSDYMKGIKEYEIQTFVLDSIRQSQDFIISIHKAASKIIAFTPLIDDTIFFYSILRDNFSTSKYFEPSHEFDYTQIVIVTNKIIDMINSGHATAERLGQLCIQLGEALPGVQYRTLPILDQLKIGSISRLPAILINEEETNVNINEYELFILDIISDLASDGNTRDIINIVQKSYDNNAELGTLYYSIAENLPTDLFGYLQSKLPEKVDLGKYIRNIKDYDHANYLLLSSKLIKVHHMINITKFIEPDDFVDAIYISRSFVSGDKLVKRIIARNTPISMDEAGNIKWAKEVATKWADIKKEKERRKNEE